MEQNVALITGASSGFGKSTASLLSERGFKVFGTSRKPSNEGARSEFEMLTLDVNSDSSVASCVSALLEKVGRIDLLVNNAGYVLTGAIEETSIEEAKSQFETNFFGVVRMTNAVLPTMRRQNSGLIINLASIAAILPVPFEGFYAATKAAIIAYSEALRYEVKSFNIKVSVVEPGFFKTNIGKAKRNSERSIESYSGMKSRAVSVLLDHVKQGDNPDVVAKTILKIVETASPRLAYSIGKEKWYLRLKNFLPQSMFENGIRRHWKLD